MRNADFGIDDWQISLCRGDGYEIFACTLYIQTASYPARQTKSMGSKPLTFLCRGEGDEIFACTLYSNSVTSSKAGKEKVWKLGRNSESP